MFDLAPAFALVNIDGLSVCKNLVENSLAFFGKGWRTKIRLFPCGIAIIAYSGLLNSQGQCGTERPHRNEGVYFELFMKVFQMLCHRFCGLPGNAPYRSFSNTFCVIKRRNFLPLANHAITACNRDKAKRKSISREGPWLRLRFWSVLRASYKYSSDVGERFLR